MSTWLQARAVRKTATKGPNPVWISARKNVNQSRRRRLARDAAGCASTALDASVRLAGSFSPRSSQSTGSVVVIVEVDSVLAPVPSREGQRRPDHRTCQPPRSLLLPEHPAITNPRTTLGSGRIRECPSHPMGTILRIWLRIGDGEVHPPSVVPTLTAVLHTSC